MKQYHIQVTAVRMFN